MSEKNIDITLKFEGEKEIWLLYRKEIYDMEYHKNCSVSISPTSDQLFIECNKKIVCIDLDTLVTRLKEEGVL